MISRIIEDLVTSSTFALKISTSRISPSRSFTPAATLDQQELAFHVVFIAEHLHLLHADQLVELLHQLLDVRVVAQHHDRDAGDLAILRRADGEALDIEAAPGEQAGHAGEHARLIETNTPTV